MFITYAIIAILIFTIFTLWLRKEFKTYDKKEKIEGIALLAGGSVVITILLFVCIYFIFGLLVIPTESRLSETYPLHSLTDNYYLSCKTNSSSSCTYTFWVESEKGLYKETKKFYSDDAYFQFTEESPRVEQYCNYQRHGWWNIFAPSLEEAISTDYYIFYIPEGSISMEYALDSQ